MTTTLHLDWIQGQHRRILAIVDGLDDERLRAAPLPSGWTTLGMLLHLTEGVRFWCLEVMLGQPRDRPAAGTGQDSPEGPFLAPADVLAAEVIDRFRTTTREALDAVRPLDLTTPPAWWPEGEWGGWRLTTLNEVLLHLLVETACHAGHLDAARELLDGGTYDYATGRIVHRANAADRLG